MRRVANRLRLVLFAWLCLVSFASAQFREEFESPNVAWKLSGADCGVRSLAHKRTFDQSHGGSSSEHLRFVAGQGTHIYYTLEVGRCPIIDESKFSLWLKADRARLQLLARVVLPRTVDERTGKPLTTMLIGEEYGEIGSWQQLQVTDLSKALARQTIVLRRQFGPHVDPREAYVDLLVLNAYAGPGETNVWTDDLEIHGVIDEDWARRLTKVQTNPGAAESKPASAGPPVTIDGNVVLINHRPALLRAIEHRGEKLDLLNALGFNALWLRTPPSLELNDEAARLGMWIIAPPPDVQSDPAACGKLTRVIAWHVGEQLETADVKATRQLASELKAADPTLRRPLLAGVHGDAWAISREVDLLGFSLPPLFTWQPLSQATTNLQAGIAQSRVGTPVFVQVPLGPSSQFLDQLAALDPEAQPRVWADLEQARKGVFAAISAGARGLLFPSDRRLDGEDELTQQKLSILRLLNLELNLIEPWVAGGTSTQELATGDPSLKATMLQTERSRLLLLTRDQPHAQFLSSPAAIDSMELTLNGIPPADRAYHLTADGLKTLEGPPGGSGSRITIPESGNMAVVAITQDPLVIQHLSRVSDNQRREMVETRLRLAANRLTTTALVVEELRQSMKPPADHVAVLREAQRHQQQADQLLARGDFTGCYRNTRRVEQLVTKARRDWWDSVQRSFPSPMTSPCCLAFDTLSSHIHLALRLRQGKWSSNALPAGDCEQLDRLLTSGWKQSRSEAGGVVATVELSPNMPHGGANSVRLAATQPTSDDTAAVSITTAPILAKAGQVVRLHGFVRVPQSIAGRSAGLRIYQDASAQDLAEVIPHAPVWREFTLYRAVEQDGPFTTTFALHGAGEAYLDDLTIEICTP